MERVTFHARIQFWPVRPYVLDNNKPCSMLTFFLDSVAVGLAHIITVWYLLLISYTYFTVVIFTKPYCSLISGIDGEELENRTDLEVTEEQLLCWHPLSLCPHSATTGFLGVHCFR